MIRRDIRSTVNAHRLDPKRRELYVEGHRDRVFLQWLLAGGISPDAKIIEITFVNVDVAEGGDRARVLALAALVAAEQVNIRGLVDADHDRIDPVPIPENVWLTDLRDLEAYCLRSDCVNKIFQLGANTDGVDAVAVLNQIFDAGRVISAMRLVSRREGLRLPFRGTEVSRYVIATKTGLTFDAETHLRVLLQKAQIEVGRWHEISAAVVAATEELKLLAAGDVVHGKDAVRLLAEILLRYGVARQDAERLLFMSFERHMADSHANLVAVLDYLQAA